jgi:hypothetical protein
MTSDGGRDRELTGRSALLKQRIERLENQEELIRNSIGGQQGFEAPENQALAELRKELELELSRNRVVIFGTSHDIQDNGHELNAELGRRLSFLTEKFAPTVMMEEWCIDRPPSFASQFAHNQGLVYSNVGPPQQEEFRTLGYAPINYPGHNGTLGACWEAPPMYEYGPLEKQENRERHMAQKVQDEMKNHQTGIFIVGLAHLHSMFSRLCQADLNVAAYSWLG